MNIEVEYSNNSNIQYKRYEMSRAAFIKHFAIAGQGYAPKIKKLIRTFGIFLYYSPFMNLDDFNINRFSNPCSSIYDPTEKAHFSNLTGKAIADFLSKKIDNSIYTVNYEAAMKEKDLPITGGRPDLIAFTSCKKTFAIEAKGYSGSSGNMSTHKKQSQTGKIPVDFSVACVSYDLYTKVKCKYYDPKNEKIEFDENLLKELTKSYYSGLLEFMEYGYDDIIEIQKEKFYKIDLFNLYRSYSPFKGIYLILPLKIREYSRNGISTNVDPFLFEQNRDKESLYIDKDRIGILIE